MSLIVRGTLAAGPEMADSEVARSAVARSAVAGSDTSASACQLRMGEEVSISGLRTESLNGERAWVVTSQQASSTGVRYGVWRGPGHAPIRVKRANLLPTCHREWPTRLTEDSSGNTQRISVSVGSLICDQSAAFVKAQFDTYLEAPLRALLQRTQCSEYFQGRSFRGALDVPDWLNERLRELMSDFGFWYAKREVLGYFQPCFKWKVYRWYMQNKPDPVLSIDISSIKEVRRIFTRIMHARHDHRDSAVHKLHVQSLDNALKMWNLSDEMIKDVRNSRYARTYTIPLIFCLTLEDFQKTDVTDMFWASSVCHLPKQTIREDYDNVQKCVKWRDWTRAHEQMQLAIRQQEDLLQQEATNAYDPRVLRNAGVCSFCQRSCGVEHMLKCGGCHVTMYCNQEHQREHWKCHHVFCKRLKQLKTEQKNIGLRLDELSKHLFPDRNPVEECD